MSHWVHALEHVPDPVHGEVQGPGQGLERRDRGDPAAAFPPGDSGGGDSNLVGEDSLGYSAEEPMVIDEVPQLGFAIRFRFVNSAHDGRCMSAATTVSTAHNALL